MRVLAVPDKFKGTATSADIGAAMVRGAQHAGADATHLATSDGGDGLLDVFGGANRSTTVTGPLGAPVVAEWRADGDVAVVECARASGLVLAGGADGNDPLAATSAGTGELIAAAVAAGAVRVVVGLGGSACTDGGLGALDALPDEVRAALVAGDVVLDVCCDVTTRYVDAARVFAPQKGAGPAEVDLLTRRLAAARVTLRDRFGVDVADLDGAGAAGGLAGGLAALGGRLRPGFGVVADHTGLAAAVARADLVLTGEGQLDASSFAGKVVGGVVALAAATATPVVAVVGSVVGSVEDVDAPIEVVSLVADYGRDAALGDVLGRVADAAAAVVGRFVVRRRRSG